MFRIYTTADHGIQLIFRSRSWLKVKVQLKKDMRRTDTYRIEVYQEGDTIEAELEPMITFKRENDQWRTIVETI